MKATALILIFSGLAGLNKCSSELEIEFPVFPHNENTIRKEIQQTLPEKSSDTLIISSISTPVYYLFQSSSNLFNKS